MTPTFPGVQTLVQFTDAYIPPDYVLDRILQKGYLYSLTGATGSGKTAATLRIAMHIALGLPLGDVETTQGRVLFLAGENPTDIQMRVSALVQQMGIERQAADIHFVAGSYNIARFMPDVEKWAAKVGGVSLVVVDTAIAYFGGDNENDNKQMVDYAQILRSFTKLTGHPSIVVNCHPSKRGNDNMPRGGGAFLNEVDGNLTCRKAFGDDGVVKLHWAEKFRGPSFEPVLMELVQNEGPLTDTRGRLMPTIVANPLSGLMANQMQKAAQVEEWELLETCKAMPSGSYSQLAVAIGWQQADGAPYKSRVQRVLKRLAQQGYIKIEDGGRWELTKKGSEAWRPGEHRGPGAIGKPS